MPDLIVQHHHGRKDKTDLAKLCYGYCLGHGALYAKHISDRNLVRNLYWEVRILIGKMLTREDTPDSVTGMRCVTLMLATIHGMLLYPWTTIGRRTNLR